MRKPLYSISILYIQITSWAEIPKMIRFRVRRGEVTDLKNVLLLWIIHLTLQNNKITSRNGDHFVFLSKILNTQARNCIDLGQS